VDLLDRLVRPSQCLRSQRRVVVSPVREVLHGDRQGSRRGGHRLAVWRTGRAHEATATRLVAAGNEPPSTSAPVQRRPVFDRLDHDRCTERDARIDDRRPAASSRPVGRAAFETTDPGYPPRCPGSAAECRSLATSHVRPPYRARLERNRRPDREGRWPHTDSGNSSLMCP